MNQRVLANAPPTATTMQLKAILALLLLSSAIMPRSCKRLLRKTKQQTTVDVFEAEYVGIEKLIQKFSEELSKLNLNSPNGVNAAKLLVKGEKNSVGVVTHEGIDEAVEKRLNAIPIDSERKKKIHKKREEAKVPYYALYENAESQFKSSLEALKQLLHGIDQKNETELEELTGSSEEETNEITEIKTISGLVNKVLANLTVVKEAIKNYQVDGYDQPEKEIKTLGEEITKKTEKRLIQLKALAEEAKQITIIQEKATYINQEKEKIKSSSIHDESTESILKTIQSNHNTAIQAVNKLEEILKKNNRTEKFNNFVKTYIDVKKAKHKRKLLSYDAFLATHAQLKKSLELLQGRKNSIDAIQTKLKAGTASSTELDSFDKDYVGKTTKKPDHIYDRHWTQVQEHAEKLKDDFIKAQEDQKAKEELLGLILVLEGLVADVSTETENIEKEFSSKIKYVISDSDQKKLNTDYQTAQKKFDARKKQVEDIQATIITPLQNIVDGIKSKSTFEKVIPKQTGSENVGDPANDSAGYMEKLTELCGTKEQAVTLFSLDDSEASEKLDEIKHNTTQATQKLHIQESAKSAWEAIQYLGVAEQLTEAIKKLKTWAENEKAVLETKEGPKAATEEKPAHDFASDVQKLLQVWKEKLLDNKSIYQRYLAAEEAKQALEKAQEAMKAMEDVKEAQGYEAAKESWKAATNDFNTAKKKKAWLMSDPTKLAFTALYGALNIRYLTAEGTKSTIKDQQELLEALGDDIWLKGGTITINEKKYVFDSLQKELDRNRIALMPRPVNEFPVVQAWHALIDKYQDAKSMAPKESELAMTLSIFEKSWKYLELWCKLIDSVSHSAKALPKLSSKENSASNSNEIAKKAYKLFSHIKTCHGLDKKARLTVNSWRPNLEKNLKLLKTEICNSLDSQTQVGKAQNKQFAPSFSGVHFSAIREKLSGSDETDNGNLRQKSHVEELVKEKNKKSTELSLSEYYRQRIRVYLGEDGIIVLREKKSSEIKKIGKADKAYHKRVLDKLEDFFSKIDSVKSKNVNNRHLTSHLLLFAYKALSELKFAILQYEQGKGTGAQFVIQDNTAVMPLKTMHDRHFRTISAFVTAVKKNKGLKHLTGEVTAWDEEQKKRFKGVKGVDTLFGAKQK